jgi:hypothetical protein
MVGNTCLMAPKKTTTGKPDTRKPFRMIRVRIVLADAGEKRAQELAQDFTQYVNDALRMRLEAEGCWPPRKS